MTIRHKDIAIGRNGDPAGLIEGIGPISRHALLAEGHQHTAGWTQLEDLVAPGEAVRALSRQPEHRLSCVGVTCPNISLRVDSKAMRKRKHPAAKASQKLARRIEFQNRRLGAADTGGG